MSFVKIRSLSLAVVIGLGAIFLSLNLFGITSAVLAQPHQKLGVHVVFTDPATLVDVVDKSGNIFEGVHTGEIRCWGDKNCNKKTKLVVDGTEYVYQFQSLQALVPGERRLIVAGKGTITVPHKKPEGFLFTAEVADNEDGTVWVSYAASRPDAYFAVPSSPGTFEMLSLP